MKPFKNFKALTAIVLLAASPLALLATSETDHKIELVARDSYNFRVVLSGKVGASASDGVVTLVGTVEDAGEKNIAEYTVAEIPGVVSVDDRIEIKPGYPEHSDGWIAFKIRAALLVRANVSATNTTVEVKDGVVSLSGTADSSAQKQLTEVYAREITGVKSVVNGIVVIEKSVPSEPIGDKIDDASITAEVKFVLLSQKGTNGIKTHVATTEGVVTLNGHASSEAEKTLATKYAEAIRGVKSVENDMTVDK
jgi:hyperosmotically inducible protein